jgi:hypothetical protein
MNFALRCSCSVTVIAADRLQPMQCSHREKALPGRSLRLPACGCLSRHHLQPAVVSAPCLLASAHRLLPSASVTTYACTCLLALACLPACLHAPDRLFSFACPPTLPLPSSSLPAPVRLHSRDLTPDFNRPCRL